MTAESGMECFANRSGRRNERRREYLLRVRRTRAAVRLDSLNLPSPLSADLGNWRIACRNRRSAEREDHQEHEAQTTAATILMTSGCSVRR